MTNLGHRHITGALIEGIADDIIVGTLMFFVILAVFIAYIIKSQTRVNNPQIHPESEDNISSARTRLRQQNQMPTLDAHPPPNDLSCPICLGAPTFAVETNCGHIFCAHCVLTYWQFGNWLGAMKCPICRQQVSILLFNFTADELNTASEERSSTVRDINNYNRRFSGEPRPWIDHIRDLPTLLRYAISELFSLQGLVYVFHLRIVVCIVIALLYFLMPFDFIPEGAFGILGFFDDLFIVFMLAIYITIIYRRFIGDRAAEDNT